MQACAYSHMLIAKFHVRSVCMSSEEESWLLFTASVRHHRTPNHEFGAHLHIHRERKSVHSALGMSLWMFVRVWEREREHFEPYRTLSSSLRLSLGWKRKKNRLLAYLLALSERYTFTCNAYADIHNNIYSIHLEFVLSFSASNPTVLHICSLSHTADAGMCYRLCEYVSRFIVFARNWHLCTQIDIIPNLLSINFFVSFGWWTSMRFSSSHTRALASIELADPEYADYLTCSMCTFTQTQAQASSILRIPALDPNNFMALHFIASYEPT